MDDSQVHATIEQLVVEEPELWERESALRQAGGDPDEAEVRRPEVVES
jgi:hypothetical protein